MQAGADLIEASRRGDRAAFAQIVERYQRAVYAVAYSGTRDRSLADDIAQDTFVIAWRRLGELRDAERLGAWLCGIARNRAREARRQTHREVAVESTPDVIQPTTPYDAVTDAQAERIVAAALGQVPDVYREPLVLYYCEERSIEDVARTLGISPATTNKRLSRGRRYLAERVAIVEQALVRFAPASGFAASVLVAIKSLPPAAHVEPSAVAKVTASRTDAHAVTPAAHVTSASNTKTTDHAGSLCNIMEKLHAQKPSAWQHFFRVAAAPAGENNDCTAVGEHLADLQDDATHGPDHRPEEAAHETCSATYTALCESEGWSTERRSCVVAAGDLINAHLCAGQVPQADAPANAPTNLPANLACSVLGPQVASILHAGGFHEDVADLGGQIEAACEVGKWPVEVRTCFADAQTIDALEACIHVEGE
jgi:RNA polymerase sigma factor (sigma-70 family)